MIDCRLFAAKFDTRAKAAGLLGAVEDIVRQVVRLGIRKLNPVRDEFDIRHGTETGGSVKLWKYRINSPNAKHGVFYISTSEKHIRVLLSPLPRTATFVDLGCGKGRPLIVAAAMGFKSVVGVEFVKELVETARENLRKAGANATVLCADAAYYDFPPGTLVVYLYDPFDAAVMSSVAQNLRRHKGELWVVYVNPEHGSLFDSWMTRTCLTPDHLKVFSPGSVSIWHKVVPDEPSESSVVTSTVEQ